MKRTIAIALVVGLFGCGGEERPAPERATPSAPAGDEPSAPVPAQPRPQERPADDEPSAAPEAVTIRVVNDTAHPAVLERTFGPAEPLSIVRLDGALDDSAGLEQQDDARTDWIASCTNPCDRPGCVECERPQQVLETLAPGEVYALPWSGRLVRHRMRDDGCPCTEPFTPPAGRYLLTACTTERGCGRVEVRLPASGPIEVPLSSAVSLESCGDVSASAMERAGARLRARLERLLSDRPFDRCPARPRCVAPEAIDAALVEAREAPCSLFVVPRGHELEVILLAPPPPGSRGGEQFHHWLDPDATRLLRVHYAQ